MTKGVATRHYKAPARQSIDVPRFRLTTVAKRERCEKLRELRQQGMTIEQIAEATGLGVTTVNRILRGKG